MTLEHLPIFVYGTLQRGEERERMWPFEPERIEWATVRARLYDLGPYPAMVYGDQLVRGELWYIDAEKMKATLYVLDRIEGCSESDADLYVRRIVDCQTLGGEDQRAYTYIFANPDGLVDAQLVEPNEEGYCHWRRQSSL